MNEKIKNIIKELSSQEKEELFYQLKKGVYYNSNIVMCPNCGSRNFYRYKNGQYRCQRCSIRYEKDGDEINE